MNKLSKLYFKWLLNFVQFDEECDYSQLLEYLFLTEFVWVDELDGNLAVHGFSMREQFLDESANARRLYEKNDFILDNCSVLEVFVSMAVRIEEDIMANSAYGDRTMSWFWLILYQTGLSELDNSLFDSYSADEILDNTINQGKICVKKCVKNETIWNQLMKLISEYALKNGEID